MRTAWGYIRAGLWTIPATVCRALAFCLVMVASWITDGYEWCSEKARRAKDT